MTYRIGTGFAEKEIEELKKENAELKSKKGCETCTKFDEVKLIKAKEIIKKLLNYILTPEGFENGEVIKLAEQFLEEEE